MIEDIRNPSDEILDLRHRVEILENNILDMANKLNEVISYINEKENKE